MINRLLNIALSIFLFLLPLFYLPLGNLSIEVDKQALLVFSTIIIFFLFALKTVREKKISFVRTPFDFIILALALFYLLSTFISSPNKIESLASPMGAGTILACVLLYFTLTQSSVYQILNTKYFIPLLLSSTLVSLFIVFKQFSISPLGGLLSTLTFLLPVAIYTLVKLIAGDANEGLPPMASPKGERATKRLWRVINFFRERLEDSGGKRERQDPQKNKVLLRAKSAENNISCKQAIFELFALFFLSSALIISAFHLATDQKPLLLPFQFGWSIMMEIFKNMQNFLFGVGPGNFSFAYSLAKPVAINTTPFWNLIPAQSSNLVLTIATEAGTLASFAFIILSIKVFKYLIMSEHGKIFEDRIRDLVPSSGKSNHKHDKDNDLKTTHYETSQSCEQENFGLRAPFLISLLTALVLQFLFPGHVALFVLIIILLASATPKWQTKQITINNQRLSIYLLLPIGLICLITLFFQGKFYLADLFYRESIVQANAQKLADSFNFSQKAIELNPDSSRNFILSSNLSLAIARNLIQNLGAEATTSANQQNISRFTQQAIFHAQRAIELNRQNSQNWAQLAGIYQSLAGSLPNAERFALDAYNQQLLLDPNSPQVKLTVGGFLMSLGQYQLAQTLFIQAVNLKPDWNNAHYNLAVLFNQTKNYQEAAAELQKVLDLTPSDSEDYKQIQKQLEAIKSLLPLEATPSGSISTPSATPKIKPTTSKPSSIPTPSL